MLEVFDAALQLGGFGLINRRLVNHLDEFCISLSLLTELSLLLHINLSLYFLLLILLYDLLINLAP